MVSTSYYKSLPAYSSLHNYTYHWNVSGWGWVHLILGILAVAAGACVLLGQNWARWAGIVVAALSAIGSFMFLPFYPFWSILVVAIERVHHLGTGHRAPAEPHLTHTAGRRDA